MCRIIDPVFNKDNFSLSRFFKARSRFFEFSLSASLSIRKDNFELLRIFMVVGRVKHQKNAFNSVRARGSRLDHCRLVATVSNYLTGPIQRNEKEFDVCHLVASRGNYFVYLDGDDGNWKRPTPARRWIDVSNGVAKIWSQLEHQNGLQSCSRRHPNDQQNGR